MKPFPRSVGAKGKRRWELDGGLWAAAALLTDGGVPARGGGDGWARKLHGNKRVSFPGSARGVDGRRWGLRGEPKLRGSNGGGHGRVSGRTRLGLLEPEREGGEGGRERVLHEPKGEKRAESAGEMEKWRTARLDASSPWRVERPSSACVQGGGAAWRGREASGEPKDGEGWGRGEGAARGRRRDGDAVTADNRARRWTEGKIVNKTKFQNSSL